MGPSHVGRYDADFGGISNPFLKDKIMMYKIKAS